MYGNKIDTQRLVRSVIGSMEKIHESGNFVLRVGHEILDNDNAVIGWEQTEYVVFTPAEASAFFAEFRSLLSLGEFDIRCSHGTQISLRCEACINDARIGV